MAGLSLGTTLMLRTEQRLQQTLTPQQRQLVSLLELSDDQVMGYIDELIRDNPALARALDGLPTRAIQKGFARKGEDERGPIEHRKSAPPALEQTLLAQFGLEKTTEEEQRAAVQIIWNLDHRGILAIDLEEVATLAEVDEMDAEDAQFLIMELDPVGCGASSLEEYLVYMIKKRWPGDTDFVKIVRHHIDLLKRKKYKLIADALDIHHEDVEEYHKMLVEEIEPWPARAFVVDTPGAEPEVDFVQPCMEVYKNEETLQWSVRMFDPPKSKLRIDPAYEEKVQAMEAGPAKKEAVEQLEKARWVVQNMAERHSLVKQIAEHAVRHQRERFEKGPAYMRNLTMATVSEIVRRDTSTISRAVMGRYLKWDGGVMALRDLFVNRGASSDVSEARLHATIQEMVDAEDKRKPLSDLAIATELKRKGISASRRTVAKHRDRMGIPSSRDRRQR